MAVVRTARQAFGDRCEYASGWNIVAADFLDIGSGFWTLTVRLPLSFCRAEAFRRRDWLSLIDVDRAHFVSHQDNGRCWDRTTSSKQNETTAVQLHNVMGMPLRSKAVLPCDV